jgi:hypothetical protein
VETARDLIATTAEFTTGVEFGHDGLEGGDFGQGVLVDGDTAAIFLDRDHHFKGAHTPQTLEALRVGRTAGFEVAISNPCFELWLLLHHEEVSPDADLDNCASVESSLRARLGSYNKTNILPGQFPLDLVETAIRRARALEKSPDSSTALLPLPIGTRVYRLLEKILSPAL